MRLPYHISSVLFFLCTAVSCQAQSGGGQETWWVDNLEQIGGHAVTVLGDPRVVPVENGKAVAFDGDGDQLLVHSNPIGTAKEFTVEVVFRPEASYPDNADPRFVHIQDPEDPAEKRVMIELRLNNRNFCYLDGFIRTDAGRLALIDSTLLHPSETWIHAAVTYSNGVFRTYVQGREELSGEVPYLNEILPSSGMVSLGARMDRRNWFRGEIRMLRVTGRALRPDEFAISD